MRKRVVKPQVSILTGLGQGVWRLPPDRWVLSLRRMDGTREIRNLRGDLLKARGRRDELMGTGRYTMAWLMESRDDVQKKPKTRERRGETDL